MNTLSSYTNGNYKVTLYSDGSKEREYTSTPSPVFPESIDVKITNYCDAGCAWCHEMSTTEGKHGDIELALQTLSDLPGGVEIAIGGGNPLSHPDIHYFLGELKKQGIVSNMTMNAFHMWKTPEEIHNVLNQKLIYGLGASYNPHLFEHMIPFIKMDNTVIHLIIGVHPISEVENILKVNPNAKILLLGYKQFGRGNKYYEVLSKRVEENIYGWYTQLPKYFDSDMIISFDNLAIKQLDLKRFFTEDGWNTFYMGNDGEFTMYMDFIKRQYAVSSTSKDRYEIDGKSEKLFKHVREVR